MKRIVLLFGLLLVTVIGMAQAPSNYTNINGRYRWIAGMFDSTFSIPKGSSPSLRTGGSTNPGAIFYNTTDSTVYTYTGTQWIQIRGAVIDTTSLSNRINLKLNISDTASMLAPYLRKVDTASLSNRINLKLNISDTATMLGNYLNNVGYGLIRSGQILRADSATLANYFLRRKDSLTTTNPLGYVTKTILADTASAIRSSAVSGFVPYTGATQNVNLGQYGITSKWVQFDTSSQAVTARRLQWSNDDGTLQFGMTNGSTITQRIGLEQYARVKNVDATQINKGDVVYLFGASGDRASVKKADNRSEATSSKTLGVATENIAVNDVGFVGTFGVVPNLNLAAFAPGDILYLDSVPGQLTKTKPQAPYNMVFIGVVERANSGNGLLFVNPQNGYELEELHNVKITSPVRNNAILIYDSIAKLWIDTTINQAGLAVTQVNTNAATGITGGPINTTGTISADTLLLSTRLWRQKGIDSVQSNLTAGLATKLNISDTASMLSPYVNNVGYGLLKSGQVVRADSATLSNYYLRRKDSLTSTNLLGYVTGKILADSTAAVRAAAGGGSIGGSGTTNYIAKFTSSTAVGNSIMSESGSSIFINGNLNLPNANELQWKDNGGTSYNVLYMFNDNNIYLSAPVASSNLIFRGVGYAERMRITSGGQVGIGTTSPNIAGANKGLSIDGTSTVLETNVSAARAGYLYSDGSFSILGEFRNLPLLFRTNDTERMRITSDGNVGIGTSSPSYTLDLVTGVARMSTNRLSTNSGTDWQVYKNGGSNSFGIYYSGGSDALTINTSQQVGINTGTIGSTLQVNGNAAIGYSASTAAPTNGLAVAGSVYINNGNPLRIYNTGSGDFGNITFETASGFAFDKGATMATSTTSSANILTLRNTNASVGNGAPTIALDCSATNPDQAVDIRLGSTNPKGIRMYTSTTSLTGSPTGASFQMYSNTASTLSGQLYFDAGALNAAFISFRTAPTSGTITERMRITSGGDVIVGNGETAASPSTGIISGTGGTGTNIAGAEFRIRGGASTGNAAGGPITFYTGLTGSSGTGVNAAVERMRIASGGNVGIGTNNPLSRLEVNSGTGTAPTLKVYSTVSNYTANLTVGIFELGSVNAGNDITGFRISAISENASSSANVYATFSTRQSSVPTEQMRLTSAGSLGIGTTTIGSKLQVNGNAAIGYSASTAAPTNGLVVAGNAGIGTTAPTSYGASVRTLAISGSANGLIDLMAGSTVVGQIAAGTTDFYIDAKGASNVIRFLTNATERMKITSAGELQLKPDANTSALTTSASYSITGSNAQSLLDLAGTWNTTGNPTAIKLNITNTASGASANLMDLQVGGVSQFTVTKGGAIQTSAPTGGTAQPWKLGNRVVTGVTFDNTQYIRVEINGVEYYLATVTIN